MPLPLELLNYGSQALSYGITGKGIGDNLASHITESDCGILNIFTDGSYCIEIEKLEDYLE